MAQDRQPPRDRGDWMGHALVVILLAALVGALAAFMIRQEREQRRHFAASQTRNLALLIETQLAGVLAQADLRLLAAGADLPAGSGGWSAGHPTPAPGLRIEGPLRLAERQWVMRLLRPARAHGAPPVRVDLPVDQFAAILDRVELGTQGAATIRTTGLALVYRSPMTPGGWAQLGRSEVSPELRQMIASHPEAGDYVASTALDGVARISAYQRVDGYPFFVLVGLPEDQFPRGWSTLDATLFALAVATALAAAYGAVQFRRASRRQIDAVQRRYRQIVESTADAIISKTLSGRVTSWNAAAERIFGWTAGEMLGQPLSRLFPPDRLQEEGEILARLRRGERVEPFETERLHRDGHRIPLSVTISPLHDARGRVIGASKIARDISRRKALEAEIRELAFLDPLTRLPNRRLLLDRLQQAQHASRRSAQWAGVMFLDLDRFKALNDTHGHAVGDLFLAEVGRRLVAAVRESDTVARMGGDEFVILCENLGTERGDAQAALHVIADKVAESVARPWALRDIHHVSHASIGCRLFRGAEEDIDQVLRDADAGMYADKQRRRGA